MPDRTPLADRACLACDGKVPAATDTEVSSWLDELSPDWALTSERRLERAFRFKDFREAQAFTNKVADIAEEFGHHPDLLLRWGEVRATIWTHSIDDLTEADFVLAARIERAHRGV